MPLKSFLDKWLKDAVKPRVRDVTYHNYSELMNNYVREGLGTKLISKVTTLEIQALYSALLERGLAVVTVQKVHTVLGSAYKQAVKWGFIGINPMDGVEVPRDRGKTREEKIKIIPLDRVPEFLEAAYSTPRGVVFALALGTGMRPGEYLALKWEDVDFEKKLVRVQRTIYRHRKGGGWSFQAPKTKGSVRSISLPDELVEDLEGHRAEQIRLFGETPGADLHQQKRRTALQRQPSAAALQTADPGTGDGREFDALFNEALPCNFVALGRGPP